MTKDELLKRVIKYLTIRNRSSGEIKKYLEKLGATETQKKEILSFLQENQLLDDEFFSTSFIEYKLSKGYSPKLIKLLLKEKGIEYKSKIEIDIERIVRTVLRKYQKEIDNTKTKQEKIKLISKIRSFLIRRGFSYDEINEILKNINLDKN